MTDSDFKPAWPLGNRHMQTLWPFVFRRRIFVPFQQERVELPDGDFIDVFWCGFHVQSQQAQTDDDQRPIVIVLHGLGGCFESHYVKGMITALHKHGYRVAFMHARGCSGDNNRLPRTFHAADTSELDTLAQLIRQRYPSTVIAALGFSLGASILLKWLGAKNTITAAAAVSVPFNLADTAKALNHGFARLYQTHLLRRLKSLTLNHINAGHLFITKNKLQALSSLAEYDQHITAPVNGFRDASHYYQVASCTQYLINIQNPTLIINARDDPFVPPHSIPINNELGQQITMELSNAGGHVGFLQGNPLNTTRYLEHRIPHFLNMHCK